MALPKVKDPATKFMLTLLSAHNERFLLKKSEYPYKKTESFHKIYIYQLIRPKWKMNN
jgi:hypothetical protein